MIQGIAALTYNSIPYINILLFLAAVILFSGCSILVISRFKTTDKL